MNYSILMGLFAAMSFGMSKTGVPGIGMLGVIAMAAAFGDAAKLSAGAVVPLLIVADLFAISYYFRSCDWTKIRLLVFPVLIGFAIGAVVLQQIDDRVFCIMLGSFIIVMTAFEHIRRYFAWENLPHSKRFAWTMGILGGSSTVIANAAGPVMLVYISSLGFSKEKMMGTISVFFLLLNLAKFPIVASLGLVTAESLLFDLYLLPGIVVGALIGRRVFLLIPEKLFFTSITFLNILAALMLFF